MITARINALFQFIEFLHSNIDNFKQFDTIINELHLLGEERHKLRPQHNFKDKLKYDEINAQKIDKQNIIQENIFNPIIKKAKELNVCDIDNIIDTVYAWNISDIHDLQKNFTKKDLPAIFIHRNKYNEFKMSTNTDNYQTFLLQYLDEILKQLFDYFKESEHYEYEAFETKTIKVNSNQVATILISDNEFIKGSFDLIYVPQGYEGYFEVKKGNETRRYTLNKYFDLHLKNWEELIDNVKIKEEKLLGISNAIFDFQKYEYNYSHNDQILDVIQKNIKYLENIKEYVDTNYQQLHSGDFQNNNTNETQKNTPLKFEDLFYNPNNSNICLEILRVLAPPFIDSSNTYIGKNKGIFPLWIKVLKTHNPEPLIKHFDDKTYKNILNNHFKGLNLSKDASEFRKVYARLDTKGLEQQIKTILSQFSQSGRLGK